MRHCLLATLLMLLLALPGDAADAPYPVGLRQIEFTDGERQIALAMFYPAEPKAAAKPSGLPFFVNLQLYRDAPRAAPRPETG